MAIASCIVVVFVYILFAASECFGVVNDDDKSAAILGTILQGCKVKRRCLILRAGGNNNLAKICISPFLHPLLIHNFGKKIIIDCAQISEVTLKVPSIPAESSYSYEVKGELHVGLIYAPCEIVNIK